MFRFLKLQKKSWSSRATGLAAIAKRFWKYRSFAFPWARS